MVAMRVHLDFRVNYVCTENADVTIWLPKWGGYDPDEPVQVGSRAPNLPVGPIPYRID
jgi:hypothetical protein